MGLRDRQNLHIYRFVISASDLKDPRANDLLNDAHALGITAVEAIRCEDLYFIEGDLSEAAAGQLAERLLADPISQHAEWSIMGTGAPTLPSNDCYRIEVALRPGVTNPVAEQIVRAAEVLQIPGIVRASTGQRFLVSGQRLNREALSLLASRLLSNPIIQWHTIGEIQPVFPEPVEASGAVDHIAICEMIEDELLALSKDRRAGLDLPEMLAIQHYFQNENRDVTDVEFEAIAQTWSEHCVHKTFKARITILNPGAGDSDNYTSEVYVNNLFKTYFCAATETINAPWVRSAFVDNAGIIDFDDMHEISIKVETHNHPSAIEPFGGANTGVGGVIRDVIGVSAKPIAAMDVLCFGPANTPFEDIPAGVIHPRRIRSGVVAGVRDYGNKIGIPTVSGAVLYDTAFSANPLVFCGCVGIAPKNRHPHLPKKGDHVIVLGGRTGRDGLRGATFSSMTMDAQTGEVAGASVQIGDPIVEKGLIDVILQARDRELYSAITDCGAGGLSSAVGEMASTLGADVDLASVQLKYPGLAPWEIWLSEAQERMVLAVPEENLSELRNLCGTYDVPLTDIGRFTGTERLVVRHNTTVVLNLENRFLHDGIPQRQMSAILPERTNEYGALADLIPASNLTGTLLALLAHPNIASKASIIRTYDHEVQGGTVIKPLTGANNDGPSDAVVLKPTGTAGNTAIVLGAGINPEYGKRSPYRMAWSVIDEAIRNAVAVGADPDRIALLDNFCWGDPKNPLTLGALVECARGCYDAALFYGTPFVSGKDSLNNEYMGKDGHRHAIPPTLLISSLGLMEDLSRAVSMDFKQAESLLYLVGEFSPTLGGSHFETISGIPSASSIPRPSVRAKEVYRSVHKAIQMGWVRACHDLSEGGLAIALTEMCIAGRLGLSIDLETANPALTLFGETNGCLLLEVSPELEKQFEGQFQSLQVQKLGAVTETNTLLIQSGEQVLIEVAVDILVAAWKSEA
jgi:phosphoribosylformylglycinamidine synthase subunit PurSL